MLTIEEPRTGWKEETRTKWDTVTERVPRRVHETTEDEIIVTTTRNGSIENEEGWVRKFPLSFHQLVRSWPPRRCTRAGPTYYNSTEPAWPPASTD